jgi:hypothetical protein
MDHKKKIPVFIIEEHHEAFIVWNYAIQQGWMPVAGNCLFHVDEHSDMGTPRFNESIHNLNGDIEKIKDFTYRELNIASFIMPACYKEIFNQVYWIRQKHRKTLRKPVEMFVRTYNKGGKRLMSGKMKDVSLLKPFDEITNEIDLVRFDYFLRTIDLLPSHRKVVLDIDLDYFSCINSPNENEEIYVEITKEEYNDFVQNKYHRLRYNVGKVEAKLINNKHYYVINCFDEIYPSKLKVNEEQVVQRINTFISVLKRKDIQPILIDICRSRYSGYTPSDQWKMIEEKLLSSLQGLYNIELSNYQKFI